MEINDRCFFYGTKGTKECFIIDKTTKLGPSIQNDALQTMDLSLNTYYKIEYLGKEIWVTSNFLELIK